MSTIDPYPLRWPAGWPRNQHPEANPKFVATIFSAERGVRHELELLGARDIVITCNALRNRDGSIATRQPGIEDTGVAVYFTLRGEARVIPCDKWTRLEHNLRAIEKMVNALRGLERWGARQMVDRSFQGMTALTAGGSAWHEVLGVSPTASKSEIDAAYRQLARATHPDAGGNAEAFHRLQLAYQEAKAA